MRIETGPREVIGYHGCTLEAAERLLAGESWLVSQNRYDWLGEGIYFWEYAPYRALEWAEQRYGADAAVIRAHIRLGHSLNLLDRKDFTALRAVHQVVVEALSAEGLPVPINTARGAHFLDRHIIDAFCARTSPDRLVFQTVRGCFPEGEPLYPGSKILTLAHVQVAVRDAGCIRSARLVQFPRQRMRRAMSKRLKNPTDPEVLEEILAEIRATTREEWITFFSQFPDWDPAWANGSAEAHEPASQNGASKARVGVNDETIVVLT